MERMESEESRQGKENDSKKERRRNGDDRSETGKTNAHSFFKAK